MSYKVIKQKKKQSSDFFFSPKIVNSMRRTKIHDIKTLSESYNNINVVLWDGREAIKGSQNFPPSLISNSKVEDCFCNAYKI